MLTDQSIGHMHLRLRWLRAGATAEVVRGALAPCGHAGRLP